jgi:prephenate dehydratase
MRNHVVAIQGSVSSFHDLAAKKYFGEDINIVECNSFRDVCDQLSKNKVDYGIIAIENKVAGSILLNYQLIDEFDLSIIGETYLPIELHLLGKKGTKLSDIKEIISHPMALGQCQYFLTSLENVTATEYRDTATSAQLISKENDKHLAVIAGPMIEERYNLERIVSNVGDEKINYTRFYILSKGNDYDENSDKASITLQTKNEIGCLSDVLSILKKNKINLTKIQSVPIPHNTSAYAFHLDLEFEDKQILEQSMKEIEPYVISQKILGIYKKGYSNNIALN